MPISQVDGSTTTTISGLLKETYGEAINNMFRSDAITYNQFEKSDRRPAGKGYNFNATYADPQGVGARGEGQPLPDPLSGDYGTGKIKAVSVYGTLRNSGMAIEASKGNMAAFMESLGGQVKGAYESMKQDLNRQCHSDGFGAMATLSGASDSLSTTTTWTATCDNATGLKNLRQGMVVDFYNTAGAIDQSATSSRIKLLNPSTGVVTFEKNDGTYKANHPITAARSYTIATDTVASGSVIVRQGAREAAHATSDTPKEITGLQGIFDDGTLLATYEGITVTANPLWAANVIGNSNVDRELTLDLMYQALDRTRLATGMTIGTIRMGLGQKRKYLELLSPDVRYAPGKLNGGYEELTFAGGDGRVNIIVDPDMAPGKITFEPTGVIKKYELAPLGWGNLDQEMHQRPGYDQWDQFLRIYTNLGVEHRNCLTMIKDLTEPSIY